MAASFVDDANTGADSFVTSRSVSKPGGVATGDVGVFFLVRWNESASFPAVTAPGTAVLRGTVAIGEHQTLVYLMYTGAESSYNFSWTGSRWSCLSALFFTGVDPGLDLSTVPFDSDNGTGTAVATTTVSTVTDAALAWNVNTQSYTGATTHAPPTNFIEEGDFDPWASAYRISPGTGSQDAANATISVSQDWSAALLALAPEAGGTEFTREPADTLGLTDAATPDLMGGGGTVQVWDVAVGIG